MFFGYQACPGVIGLTHPKGTKLAASDSQTKSSKNLLKLGHEIDVGLQVVGLKPGC